MYFAMLDLKKGIIRKKPKKIPCLLVDSQNREYLIKCRLRYGVLGLKIYRVV